MGESKGRDFHPDEGPVDFVKREKPQTFIVPREFEISIQESPCQRRLPAGLEIHHRKRHVVDDVDPTQTFTELDAVECDNPVVKEHEIGQVKIPMALSNESPRFSFLKLTGMSRVELSEPVPKLLQGLLMFGKGAMRGDLFKDFCDDPCN